MAKPAFDTATTVQLDSDPLLRAAPAVFRRLRVVLGAFVITYGALFIGASAWVFAALGGLASPIGPVFPVLWIAASILVAIALGHFSRRFSSPTSYWNSLTASERADRDSTTYRSRQKEPSVMRVAGFATGFLAVVVGIAVAVNPSLLGDEVNTRVLVALGGGLITIAIGAVAMATRIINEFQSAHE